MANMATFSSDDKKTDFHVGDTIRVHYKLIEKEKTSGKTKREVKVETRERIQVFEGNVIAIKGTAENKSFIVRHIGVGAIGVERIFPLISPWIKKIEVKKFGDVRRAKLYYLRDKVGKAAYRIDELKPAESAKPTSPVAKTPAKAGAGAR
jgi:large subunit ribosomal protein L19